MVETRDGLMFVVVGYLHPPGRVTAYLKYVPTAEGKWDRGDTRYTRTLRYYHVTQVENTYGYLRENHPDYLYDCPVRNITVSCVPLSDVKRYYDPVERVDSLFREGPSDPLEEKLLGLVEYLQEHASVEGKIGVTGSILTGSHNPEFSDIDITVYGREESRRVREAVLGAREEAVIRGRSEEELERWVAQRAEKFPLSREELRRIASRRWNYGFYKDTYVSIHPIRTDDEITESYGDFTYSQLGEVKGTAVVVDAAESIYLPAIYRVTDPKLEKSGIRVSEIVSYEGIYGGLFEEGEKVEFRGSLERYMGKEEGHRVVLGGAGSTGGYVKWA
ncbi:nucleotidyltransferase domain-containing protein [Candidatus Bathyarchaeota archaeon]|nr:nucleotidyltransferase domain-containing protein [Candidatus Bathyarchaeota archaeon]